MLLAYLDDANRTYKSVKDMLASYGVSEGCIAAGVYEARDVATHTY